MIRLIVDLKNFAYNKFFIKPSSLISLNVLEMNKLQGGLIEDLPYLETFLSDQLP